MFEALFILTTIDAGTRVARFILQEFAGRFYAPLARHDSVPAAATATLVVVVSWGYFIYAGSISTIWPMFGIANQLLATVALAITTIVLVNAGRARYAWVTITPMVFVATTTISAGILSVRDSFWPMAIGADPTVRVQGYVNTVLTIVMLCCVAIILLAAGMRWRRQRTETALDRSVLATGLFLAFLLAQPAVTHAQPESGLFRLLSFEQAGSTRLGATRGDGTADIVDIHNAVLALRVAGAAEVTRLPYIPADMRGLIESGAEAIVAARAVHDAAVKLRAAGRLTDPGGDRRVFYPPPAVRLLPPITNPSKMFGLAGNYPREGNLANPKMPSAFLKSVSALTGPEATIDLAGLVTKGVHEPELSFVIGRKAKNVPASQAFDYIVGYTICNDVSARDLPQGSHSTQGATFSKGLDTFSPCGPYLTLKEDVPDPHALAIEARLNGERWDLPNANTRHLTFKIPQLVEFLSSRMTLLPGDIVQTGVPAPVVPLRAGDTVDITIERLGTLRNRVVAKVTPGTF
jgi:2-keto-4-pentenoate hydratase/2-oxohepta-3-ene-1,7-dioic acid hydratase in catechol pathway